MDRCWIGRHHLQTLACILLLTLRFAVNKSLSGADVTRWGPLLGARERLHPLWALAAGSCDAADLLGWPPGCHRSLTRSHSGCSIRGHLILAGLWLMKGRQPSSQSAGNGTGGEPRPRHHHPHPSQYSRAMNAFMKSPLVCLLPEQSGSFCLWCKRYDR